MSETAGVQERPVVLWRVLRTLLWDVLWGGTLAAFLSWMLFALGIVLFFDRDRSYLEAVAAVYGAAGLICGWFAGGIRACHRRAADVVRSFYALIDPVLQPLVRAATLEALPDLSRVLPQVRSARLPSLPARIARWQFLRTLQRHPLANLVPGNAGATAGMPDERTVTERLVQFTTADVQGRLRLLFWAACASAVLIWSAPLWLRLLVDAPVPAVFDVE